MKVEVLEPHGMCGGVNAAIAKALTLRNVYCLHELVHNEIVVGELKGLGFKFVKRIEDVPEGETVVFSAHGVSPAVREIAKQRKLKIVDTTCPYVAKVHKAAKAFAEKGLPVVILGDPKHVEVQGIRGEAVARPLQKGKTFFLHADGGALPRSGLRIGVVSQTTMNADDVERQVAELRKKYDVETMAEVCNATRDRQNAVKAYCTSCRSSSAAAPHPTRSASRKSRRKAARRRSWRGRWTSLRKSTSAAWSGSVSRAEPPPRKGSSWKR